MTLLRATVLPGCRADRLGSAPTMSSFGRIRGQAAVLYSCYDTVFPYGSSGPTQRRFCGVSAPCAA